MGNALYRTYRSKTLDEVIGQSHITDTLKRALKENRISHAYLLTGPRGVGKTSVARILAREVNGLSSEEGDSHLDIVEIDAASNRRIDEIRDLREKVHVAPAQATYKVYIIDEAHMLTKEAFNALLKTLEEPPEHAIFILATTEYHKLPETIISRTQRFAFHPITTQDIASHLKKIAKKESIHINDDALALLAEHSGGSFRDSLSLLDQIRHSDDKKAITTDDVSALLGLAPDTLIEDLLGALESQSVEKILKATEAIRQQSIHPSQVAQAIGKRIRTQIIKDKSSSSARIKLLKDLLYVPSAPDQLIALELALLETVDQPTSEHNVNKNEAPAQEVKPAPPLPTEEPKPRKEQKAQKQSKNTESKKTDQPTQSTKRAAVKPTNQSADEVWQEIVRTLKGRHNTLYGMARMAQPTHSGDTFELACKFAFHAKRLSDSQHKKILLSELQERYGSDITLSCVVAEKPSKEQKPIEDRPKIADSGAQIENISNIFGGAEVLES